LSATSTAVEPSSEKKTCERLADRILRRHFAQLFNGVVREAGEQHVIDSGGLSGDGGDDVRVSVPVEVDPPGGDAVDQAAAVVGVEVDAFGLCDTDRRWVERLLRERMPDLQAGVHS